MNSSSKIQTWCFCEQKNPGFFLLFKKERKKRFWKTFKENILKPFLFFHSLFFSSLRNDSGEIYARGVIRPMGDEQV